MKTIFGILIPFIGTSLGSLMVFFMKDDIDKKIEKMLFGFSAGVMIASSIWSLIIPAIEESSDLGKLKWFPATIGFFLGILFLLSLDYIISNLGSNSNIKNMNMLLLAVTLHNIPEGMAVGVIFSGLLTNASNLLSASTISLASAYALSVGIAIQNFPEGAIISMPLKSVGFTKKRACIYGVLSGTVEPIAAILTLILTNFIATLLPYLLAFAAGSMFYVVINELIPEAQDGKNNYICTLGTTGGFLLMMILDVMLG